MKRVPVFVCFDCDAIFASLPEGDPNPECEGQCTFVQAWVDPSTLESGATEGYPQGEDHSQMMARSPVDNPAGGQAPPGWESFLRRPKGAT